MSKLLGSEKENEKSPPYLKSAEKSDILLEKEEEEESSIFKKTAGTDEKEDEENYESNDVDPFDMSEKEQRINLYLDSIPLNRGVPKDRKDEYFQNVLYGIHNSKRMSRITSDDKGGLSNSSFVSLSNSTIGKKRGISIQVGVFPTKK